MMKDRFWNGFGIALFTLVALFSVVLTVLTYRVSPVTTYSPWRQALVSYHLPIMLVTITLALGYGFVWARVLYARVQDQTKTSGKMLQLALSFLSIDERSTVSHLVESGGTSTQAAVGRINNMGGVRALRAVKKLESKSILIVSPQGKVRRLSLSPEILQLLIES